MGYLGIDPGVSGGLALIEDTGFLKKAAWKMPATEKDISDLFIDLKPLVSFALIEAVHSMPGMAMGTMFNFGKGYGFLRGMLIAHGIPFGEVTPQKWQKFMNCLTKGDKNVSKARAQQLFPNLKITHAIADALLIAEYCRLTRSGLDDL